MSESMEGSLGLWKWLRLRLHLFVCTWCQRYLRQIRLIRQLLREHVPNDTGGASSLDTEARQRIGKSILNKQGHTTS